MKNPLKRVLVFFLRAGNRVCGILIEPIFMFFQKKSKAPHANIPIFIIGAPRSGTTLTFQLISQTLNVGYLTNLHSYVFGLPALVSFFTRNIRRLSDFKSEHGRTRGLFGPSECGEWWYRFFRREPVYVTNSDVSKWSRNSFRRSLISIAAVEGRPIVFKNLYAGMRLEPIIKEFPEAVFIHVNRDIRDNAHSILEGRFKTFQSYEPWWSLPPPGYEKLLKFSPERQVVSQICLINNQIIHDISKLGLQSRMMTVNYEDVCADPAGLIAEVECFLAKEGLTMTRIAELPVRFEVSKKTSIPAEMANTLRAEIERAEQNG